jgi:hypothetical protein
LLIRDPK